MQRARFFAGSVALGALAVVRDIARAASPVVVLYAGSLVTIMEQIVRPAIGRRGLELRGEGKGSLALANLIASGLRSPDVFISADTVVLDGLIATDPKLVRWYATFATTRLVIGYSVRSPFAGDFASVARGTKQLAAVLRTTGLKIGRTDPALDPKGYRTLIAMTLLERAGTIPAGTARDVLGDDRNPAQIFPEETLLARLETGDLDMAFLYATEGIARKLPILELPATANLGSPAEAERYATVAVTIEGKRHVGAAATFAVTIPTVAQNAARGEAFVAFLLAPEGRRLLGSAGLASIRPMVSGDRAAVPAAVLAALT